jgi:hypothetical protein
MQTLERGLLPAPVMLRGHPTPEMHVWFLSEHLVDTPPVRAWERRHAAVSSRGQTAASLEAVATVA